MFTVRYGYLEDPKTDPEFSKMPIGIIA